LKYSKNKFLNIHEHDKVCHIWLKGSISNGDWSMATVVLKFILHLKMLHYKSRSWKDNIGNHIAIPNCIHNNNDF
jgi:hypothetical protein